MANTEDHEGVLQVYELGYLVLPSIPEENLPQVVDSIKKIIAGAGGRDFDGEMPFKRSLAYSMSKVVGASKYVVDDAYIGWLKFEMEPSSVNEVKEGVEKMSEILRFLLIKAPRESEFTFAKALEAEEAKRAAEREAESTLAEKAPEDAESSPEEDVVE